MIPPKSNQAIRFFFACYLVLFSGSVFGQAGKDGLKTITNLNTVVNDYTTLLYNAYTGSTTIAVNNNTLGTGFGAPLGTGDLIFIIQIQGASITTANDPTYGAITSYNNCGNYEYVEVASVSVLIR